VQTKRTQTRQERPINRETFIRPWPELGLIVADSPYDPAPSLVIADGVVVEMDGVSARKLRHARPLHRRPQPRPGRSRGRDGDALPRPRADDRGHRREPRRSPRLTRGCTAAKLVEIIRHLNVLEMMMGLAKLRARRTPANQAHVTNRKEHPALLAADAAEAALRGFAEVETTVGVSRYAPLNALAILVGAQIGRGGVLTQCAVEEATNLRLGFRGLTSIRRRSPSTARSAPSWTATTPRGRRRSSTPPTPAGASRRASPRAPAPRR
jgi:propanediol dehydratase large subunit